MILRVLFACALLGACTSTHAASAPDEESRVQSCLAQAAERFDIDLVALQVIREIEGGRLGTASPNTNGTFDLGPMQINSIWIPAVERAGGSQALLRDDPCVNAFVAAWIFRQEIASAGSTAQAIAQYHSRSREYQIRYLSRALAIVRQQLAREVSQLPADQE